MDAVRNERRDSPALSSDPALPPPANVADRQKSLVVNEPWADVSQYLPETKTSYAAAFFARTLPSGRRQQQVRCLRRRRTRLPLRSHSLPTPFVV